MTVRSYKRLRFGIVAACGAVAIFGIAHRAEAIYILQQPIPFTAYDNGSPFYQPDTQRFSGTLIAFDPTVPIGSTVPNVPVGQDILDKGLNPYHQGTDNYMDTTLGYVSFKDRCLGAATLLEAMNLSYVNVTAPIPSRNNPPFMGFAVLGAPPGTECREGRFVPQEVNGFPVSIPISAPYGGLPQALHAGDVTGDGAPDIAFTADVGGVFVVDSRNGQSQHIISPAGYAGRYGTFALADIDLQSSPGRAKEIIASVDNNVLAQIDSYSHQANGSFVPTPGFPHPLPLIFPPPVAILSIGSGKALTVDDIDANQSPNLVKFADQDWMSLVGVPPIAISSQINVFNPNLTQVAPFPTLSSRVPVRPPSGYYGGFAGSENVALIPNAGNPSVKDIVVVSQGTFGYRGSNPGPGSARMWIVDLTGQTLPGWPKELPAWRISQPVVGDIAGSGDYEIVALIQAYDGISPHLYAFNRDGSIVPGFPVDLFGRGLYYGMPPESQLALADLDGDGKKEIVVDGNGVVVKGDGTLLPGFPNVGLSPLGSVRPFVADVNGDSIPEIVYSASSCYISVPGERGCRLYGALYALDRRGNLIPGYPIIARSGSAFGSYLSLDDVDGDGRVELIGVEGVNTSSRTFVVHAFKTSGLYGALLPWSTYQHDERNTNFAP